MLKKLQQLAVTARQNTKTSGDTTKARPVINVSDFIDFFDNGSKTIRKEIAKKIMYLRIYICETVVLTKN